MTPAKKKTEGFEPLDLDGLYLSRMEIVFPTDLKLKIRDYTTEDLLELMRQVTLLFRERQSQSHSMRLAELLTPFLEKTEEAKFFEDLPTACLMGLFMWLREPVVTQYKVPATKVLGQFQWQGKLHDIRVPKLKGYRISVEAVRSHLNSGMAEAAILDAVAGVEDEETRAKLEAVARESMADFEQPMTDSDRRLMVLHSFLTDMTVQDVVLMPKRVQDELGKQIDKMAEDWARTVEAPVPRPTKGG